jgi:hypothetical protein
MHQLEECDGGKDVVTGRDDSSGREPPLEADREIDEGDQEGKENRDDRTASQLTSDSRTDGLSANDLETVRTEFLGEHLLNPVGDVRGTVRLGRDFSCVLRANRELPIRSELLDLRTRNAGLVKRRAYGADIRWLSETELHQGAACELDAVVGRLYRKRAKAQQNESDGHTRHHFPPADEVVVSVVKNSKH